jgi:hypothetical protein
MTMPLDHDEDVATGSADRHDDAQGGPRPARLIAGSPIRL